MPSTLRERKYINCTVYVAIVAIAITIWESIPIVKSTWTNVQNRNQNWREKIKEKKFCYWKVGRAISNKKQ